MSYPLRKLIPILLVIGVFLFWMFRHGRTSMELVQFSGYTMGSIGYTVKYIENNEKKDYQLAVDSLLLAFNQSLSTYIDDSEISRFNQNSLLKFESSFFYPVLLSSKKIYETTEGAFDPTVLPLVNAWGFGPDKSLVPDSAIVLEIKEKIGFNHLYFDSISICKLEEGIQLDFSAIAKGYAVDVVMNYFKENGYENVFVEIGGEVATIGTNTISGKAWTVGIEDPIAELNDRKLFKAFKIANRAVATSGNYRNFRVVDGVKYSHTISPYTGFPVEHSLLSASVFAPTCMEADGLATAFMVMGMEKSKVVLNQLENIDVFFIYSDPDGKLLTYQSDGLESVMLN